MVFVRRGLLGQGGPGLKQGPANGACLPQAVWRRAGRPASNTKHTGLATQETTQETTQERILTHLRTHPKSTRKTLAEVIGLSDDGVKYHLKLLSDNGKIRRVGSTKAGHWEVLN